MVHTPAVLILLIAGIVALSVVFLFQTAAKALWQKLCQPKDNMHSTSAKTLLLRVIGYRFREEYGIYEQYGCYYRDMDNACYKYSRNYLVT